MAKAKIKGFDSARELKADLKKKGSGGGGFLTIKADEAITVRFLNEPDEWKSYNQIFNGKYYEMVAEDDTRPKQSRRYVANVVVVDEGKVEVISMTPTLASLLYKYYERYETMMDRDYELSREGSGKDDTEYSAFALDPQAMKLSRYEPHDLVDYIQAQFDAQGASDTDDDDDDEDDDDKPRRSVSKRSTGTSKRPLKRRSRS